MANVYATKNGVWSDITVWNTGSLPTAADDVYANNFTVTIDTDPQVLSLRTTAAAGINAGGGFRINNAVSLSAGSLIPGSTTCLGFLSASPNSCTIVGNVSGSATTATAYGLSNNSTGTVNLIGSALAGSIANGHALGNLSTGVMNITGNITGGTGSTAYGYNTTTGSTLNVLGDIRASSGAQSWGVFINNTSATLNLTGNIIGGSGTGGSVPGNGTVGCQLTNGNATIYGYVSGGTSNWSGGFLLGSSGTGTGTATIYGNCYGGPGGTGLNTFGAGNSTSNGTLNIVGDLYAGGSGYAVYSNSTTGSVSITGSSKATSATASVYTIWNTGTNSIMTLYGNLSGGAGANTDGIRNQGTNSVAYIYGDVFGGSGGAAYGALNNSTGRVFIYGTAKASNNNIAVFNNSTGLIYATKVVGNDFGLGSVGIASTVGMSNTQSGLAYVEQVEFGSRGQTPISGPVYILPSNRNTLTGRLTALGNTVTFYNSLSVDGLLPPVSSVQAGIVYNVGNSVGTMAVPSASAVQFGVPVDNTVGTAALQPQDVWGYSRLSATEVDSMGDRLRNTATTQSIGYQIASFNL